MKLRSKKGYKDGEATPEAWPAFVHGIRGAPSCGKVARKATTKASTKASITSQRRKRSSSSGSVEGPLMQLMAQIREESSPSPSCLEDCTICSVKTKEEALFAHARPTAEAVAFVASLPAAPEAAVFAVPARRSPHARTLVLDLDETLVHCCLDEEGDGNHEDEADFELPVGGGRTVRGWERPGLKRFLEFASRYIQQWGTGI